MFELTVKSEDLEGLREKLKKYLNNFEGEKSTDTVEEGTTRRKKASKKKKTKKKTQETTLKAEENFQPVKETQESAQPVKEVENVQNDNENINEQTFVSNFPLVFGKLASENKINAEYIEQLKVFFKVDELWSITDEQKKMVYDNFKKLGII